MAYQATSQGPWLRGLVASNQPLAQPKGSFPRGSNLVMIERGALTPCDGSGIINWFSGAVQNNRGRMMAGMLFEPTGVNPYYLVLSGAFDEHLGAPANATSVDSGAGGTLGAGTYFYKVTALDGLGGETTASNETASLTILANHKITVTWNVIPNAFAYNIYRTNGASGTEVLLASVSTTNPLPVPQPNPLTATVSYVDDGTATNATGSSFTISLAVIGTGAVPATFSLTTNPPSSIIGLLGTVSGNSTSLFNTTWHVIAVAPNQIIATGPTGPVGGASGTGGTFVISVSPPSSDTTSETVLIKMPLGTIPISYSTPNFIAFFPASIGTLGQEPTGGAGGAGTTGRGITGRGTSTPSGGIAGLVGPLPQFKQFTNRACMALGNGFAPQVFWDSTGTAVNPAPTGAVVSVAVSSDQVTVTLGGTISQTDPTSPRFIPLGSNVILSNMTDSTYNGVFTVLAVSGSTFKIRNPTASGGASTGTYTVTTTPIISNYTPQYPRWAATTAVVTGDIYEPTTQPAGGPIYITCVQSGTTGSVEPTWPTVTSTGQQFPSSNIRDGSALWVESGYLASPPLPGAAHIEVYAGSLWAFNTKYINDGNGLDGPTAIRMSNTNNIFAWNPVNQAFLDKDNGEEGMALGKFTITAQGIPPEGSLIAFKYRVPYQLIGVFGANNFAIQPVSSDMGCLAPRSVVFVPGFGLMRYTHLGIAVYDGYRDTLNSEQVRPFFFPVNDFDTLDITVADANYLPLSWAGQTANPPMYAFAMPIGNSGGQLTRIMLFDLVLKAWAAPVDLPFPIGFLTQVQPVTSNPLTIFGGFNDGALQRWQAGDIQWYTGATGGGLSTPSEVAWSFRTTTLASQQSSQRIWCRKVIIRGTGDNSDADPFLAITVQIRQSAIVQSTITYNVSNLGDFEVFADVGLTGLRFDAVVSGKDHLEIDGVDWAVEPRPFGVQLSAV